MGFNILNKTLSMTKILYLEDIPTWHSQRVERKKEDPNPIAECRSASYPKWIFTAVTKTVGWEAQAPSNHFCPIT